MQLKRMYGNILDVLTYLFGIETAKQFDTLLRFHKFLNLKNPRTLSEKVCYLNLHNKSDLIPFCTDKYSVRSYIKDKHLEDILIPLVGGPWNDVDEIDFLKLPHKCVIKATHGCKMNYFLTNINNFDLDSCKKKLSEWLGITYGVYSIEPHYRKIQPRLYAEKFLDNMDDVVDYKFHCLNGNPEFILTCSNRSIDSNGNMSVDLDLFDTSWRYIDAIQDYKSERSGGGVVRKPHKLNEMIEIAKKLSSDFKFVRVDLYEIADQIYFGELTFSPACCVFPNYTTNFDYEMGSRLII